jgi:hypothetical protein
MEWLWIGGAALLGFIIGVFVCDRVARTLYQTIQLRFLDDMNQLKVAQADDRELALRTLRRELANYMVRVDPDRYLTLYRDARDADLAISRASKQDQQIQLEAITKKYPVYESFDLIETRDHVLYAETMSLSSVQEEIEEHYLSIVEFQVLKRVLDDNWKHLPPATSDSDLEHLEKYVQRIKDTKFRQRLVAAVDEFYTHRGDDSFGERIAYETRVLTVSYVHHFAENRWGFHFKDTDEFGLYTSFLDDNNKNYQEFYRSDRKFEEEIHLDYLHIDEQI